MLPKNEKRKKLEPKDMKFKVWICGSPMSGKTYCADTAPNAIMINTDGNFKQSTSPVFRLKDEKRKVGRDVKIITAKTILDEVLAELENDDSYETIVIDLIDDVYEMYREHYLKEAGLIHESDSGYGKGWDMVRRPFLQFFKDLCQIDKNIIFISHSVENEVVMANGRKLTTVVPNLPEKIVKKLTGYVDFIYTSCIDDDGNHKLEISKLSTATFNGVGNRWDIVNAVIDNNWDSIINNIK